MSNDFLECGGLLYWVLDDRHRAQTPFPDASRVEALGHGEDAFLDSRGKPEKHQHLCDPGAGDALPAGDGGLVGDFFGVELTPPFKGLAERLDHGRCPGLLGRFGRLRRPGWMPRRRDGADHAVGGHPARQDADIVVLERPIRPQGNLDGLLAEFDRLLDVVGGDMDNAEPDFRDGPSGLTAGSPGSDRHEGHHK